MLSMKQLKQLRNEIVLNSLYLSDYQNSLGVNPRNVYNFFEGYLDMKMCEYCEAHEHATPKQKDKYFEKLLNKNDYADMFNYYLDCSIEGDFLPIEDN